MQEAYRPPRAALYPGGGGATYIGQGVPTMARGYLPGRGGGGTHLR